MSDQHLHIISFNIPYPANYGGVIDVFYKAKALTEAGIKVHMHCFEYGRKRAPEMEQLFYSVDYYKRNISKKYLFKRYPYIIQTRNSAQLVETLLKDDYPILMEGIHTTMLLLEKRLRNRKRLVRTHNIEHDYYTNLSRAETDPFKKYYFYTEAGKLKKFEKILAKADHLVAISQKDYQHFSKKFKNVSYIPAFHPHKKVESLTGKGNYVLYHGNLSVPENSDVVRFLLKEVFNGLDVPVVIAGLNPSGTLQHMADELANVKLIANPDDESLKDLIKQAHVNISITGQATGMKLKLLNTLYNGRFCVVNDKMLSGNGLDTLCVVANNVRGIKKQIHKLMQREFTLEMKGSREAALTKLYNNGNNVARLIELIS